MVLIVGLGNPGKSYKFTRHNIGFRIVDKVAESFEKTTVYRKFDSSITESVYNREKVILLKPQTFMNNSGNAVASFYRFFKGKIKSILVIHDDIDIEFGEIKMKSGGSTGGHKGLESIAGKLGNYDFGRLRFGVGRPPGRQDPADYILDEFRKKEEKEVEISIGKSSYMVMDYLKEGIEYTMNKYNCQDPF